MKKAIWYISKYVAHPADNNPGSRGYLIMKEISKKGYISVIITSDSNYLSKTPSLKKRYEFHNDGSLITGWIKTVKYKYSKSILRVISWIDFELKLFLFPFSLLPKPTSIIISSLSLLTIINGIILKRRYKAKLIFEIRDIWPLTLVEEGGFSNENLLIRMLAYVEKKGYEESDSIVGTMPNLRAHVKNITSLEKPVYCIPMGLPYALLGNNKTIDEYIKNQIPKNKFIIGYAGTIGITNALEILFESSRSMVEYCDIHFLIIGEGDLRERYIEKYGKQDNVTFIQKIPRDQLQSVLQYCDVLFISGFKSKLWEYGQSLNKLIDYMYSGKPVIASLSGFQSMINEADCGSYIEAGNKEAIINEILKYFKMKKETREEIGLRGKKWLIRERTYSHLADMYLEIL